MTGPRHPTVYDTHQLPQSCSLLVATCSPLTIRILMACAVTSDQGYIYLQCCQPSAHGQPVSLAESSPLLSVRGDLRRDKAPVDIMVVEASPWWRPLLFSNLTSHSRTPADAKGAEFPWALALAINAGLWQWAGGSTIDTGPWQASRRPDLQTGEYFVTLDWLFLLLVLL
ncbi:hypothetical protein DFH08DRAFT_826439 [Mycena albidolilacea]|uniref:Uncharacterized protein n=1 Tax=Mycena albidolilacea TaxID=1033008 RepID=A0AAD7E8F7_9AGAR|nr:hypothetical protein DFH08DRAFT_826439 [Mycena albidolilacea]